MLTSVSVPAQCDPALLPEPNHVMLNHLYALSIKVMARLSLSELCFSKCAPRPLATELPGVLI